MYDYRLGGLSGTGVWEFLAWSFRIGGEGRPREPVGNLDFGSTVLALVQKRAAKEFEGSTEFESGVLESASGYPATFEAFSSLDLYPE